MENTGKIVSVFTAFCLLTFFATPAQAKPKLTLKFGVNESDPAQVVARRFFPTLKHLEREVGKELGKKVKIRLKIAKYPPKIPGQ